MNPTTFVSDVFANWMPFLAQSADAAAEAEAPGGIPMQLIIMVLLFGGMWFLLIAPQRKRQKQQRAMLSALQKGDAVLTNGGIYGTIAQVKDDRFVLEIAKGTTIEIHKNFVQSKLGA